MALPLLAASTIVGEPEELPGESNVRHRDQQWLQALDLIMDAILDIVEESLSAVRVSTNPGLLGSAVIGEMVTDIVDVTALCQHFSKRGSARQTTPHDTRRIGFYNPWPLGPRRCTCCWMPQGMCRPECTLPP